MSYQKIEIICRMVKSLKLEQNPIRQKNLKSFLLLLLLRIILFNKTIINSARHNLNCLQLICFVIL